MNGGFRMLLEFSCSNHGSIRKKVLFSLLASKDKTNTDLLTDFDGRKVLRTSVIYGANGSGKSNFLSAILFVKLLVINSISHKPGDGIPQHPHKLEPLSTSSEYNIQFVFNNIRYAFGFTLNNNIVHEEYLYYFPKGRQTKIYERSSENFVAGIKFKNKLSICRDVLKPNKLLLSCAANFTNVVEIMEAYKFFLDGLIIYEPTNSDINWLHYSLRKISTDLNIKKSISKLLQGFGTDIRDIKIRFETSRTIDKAILPDFLSDEYKEKLLGERAELINAKVVYDKFETDLLGEESVGIKKLITILCPFIDIMANGKTLVCDELENSLHEALLQELIRQFVCNSPNKQAQLIFSTHDTSLLDLDFFRRDQIWFTELRKEDRSTDLFSLAEIKHVRKDKKFGRGYIEGRYGAVPMLNNNFADIIPNLK